LTAKNLPFRVSVCPVCTAHDAFVDTLRDGEEYYVECVNCGVYRASRRAFRLFQYLRNKADPDSLRRLERLAVSLAARPRGRAAVLEYETWELEYNGS
jgi:Zn ribbon nucleic-acid-binding protein